jgi:alcohol dehydrogenase YqhD (iron-dependent ADH family)
MEDFVYSNPVKMIFGKNKLDTLAQEILPYGKRILFVYGQKHLKETGVYDKIAGLLRDAGIEWVDLEGVKSNPKLDLVEKGIQLCRQEKLDFVLGVGGGSVSDTAKAIAMGTKVDYPIWQAYEDFHNLMHGNKVESPHVPTEALPLGVVITKAATGSEFDYTTVLSNPATKEKLMIINKVMYPKFAILDPMLTYTLPREQIAFGTADIMTHYLEQYFSMSKGTEVLDRTKESGIKTVIEAGTRVYRNPQDYEAQSNLLYCAAWACSDQSMTGIAGGWDSHMIEHEITAITDLNHGWGMAIIYPGWMRYVLETIPHKFDLYADKVWGIEPRRGDIEVGLEAIERTTQYWRSLGIPLTLREAGVDPAILPQAAKQAVRFGPIGLIKPLDEQDVLNILQSVC